MTLGLFRELSQRGTRNEPAILYSGQLPAKMIKKPEFDGDYINAGNVSDIHVITPVGRNSVFRIRT
ncbi:hypothetical protein A5N83_00610 [Rhodococcus sp. 1139]|nr:hypothetical protein A5N83_00610 [Rhodococcus sp. 1139]